MWLQKRLNKRVIKMAIGSKYVYEIEAEEKIRWWYNSEDDEKKTSKLKSFFQDGVNELKKEIKKDIN